MESRVDGETVNEMKTITPFNRVNSRTQQGYLFHLTLFVFLAGFVSAQDIAVIHLKNGGTIEAEISAAGPTALTFKSDSSQFSAQMPYREIETIDWPDLLEWTRAESLFSLGRFAEAAAIYEKVAAAEKDRRTWFPAPNNYASRARRRLVSCYRGLADPGKLAYHLGKLQVDRLAPADRTITPAVRAWAAAGAEDWKKIIELADSKSARSSSNASRDGIDLAYLKGLALKNSGRKREAILSFARAFTLNAGTDAAVSRLALIEAARLTAEDETRLEEFRSQVHLYATIFGRGKLWEDAGPQAQAEFQKPLTFGETALGQGGRTKTEGERTEETTDPEIMKKVTTPP